MKTRASKRLPGFSVYCRELACLDIKQRLVKCVGINDG